jgi:hypothetical protein
MNVSIRLSRVLEYEPGHQMLLSPVIESVLS